MERILKKLKIDPEENIYLIREQLENKQLEYIDKLDRLQYNSDVIEMKQQIEQQLKLELQEIEEALKSVSMIIRMISTGISTTKVENKDKPKEAESSIKLEQLKTTGEQGNSDPKRVTLDLGNSGQVETSVPHPEADALCDEADKYLMGNGVEKDYDKAFKLYHRADQLGSLRGKSELGHMYLAGWGVPKDYGKAYELSEKAANSGVACGQCNLGVLYEYGLGVPKDVAIAVNWYRKAADQGSARGLCNLGYLYERGRGVPEDEEKAQELYQKAADQGYMSGHFDVSEMFDIKARKAIDVGAIRIMGSLEPNTGIDLDEVAENPYIKEHFDLSRGYRKVVSYTNFYYLECYTHPTENQDSRKMLLSKETINYILRKYPSDEYEIAQAENLSIKRLFEFYRAKFEKMDTIGIYRFFKRFHNVTQCEEIFKKISKNSNIEDYIMVKRITEEENDPIAYKYLGDRYYYGLGTERNFKEALRCYKRATTDDNQDEIAEMLRKVDDAITNEMIYQQAMRMLETSSFQNAIVSLEELAEKDYADAQFEMGKLYMNGYRLPNDKWKARTYLNKAMENGHPEAKEYLEKL